MEIKDKKEQVLFGRLLRVVSDITLESTKNFNTRDFFKEKSKGGMFLYIQEDFFEHFSCEIKNSPAKILARYETEEDMNQKQIIVDAKKSDIYEEVDLAHVMQICKRDIINGERLLLRNRNSNLFLIRNKKSELCFVELSQSGDRFWNISVGKVFDYGKFFFGYGLFFRN